MTELELIEHCKQDNEFAQRVLFEKNYTAAYHLAYRYLSDHHAVEDVLSVAFTKAFRGMGGFENRGEGSFKRWMNTIVVNESINLLKKKKRLNYTYMNPENGDEFMEQPAPEPDFDVERFYQLLETLPDVNRLVFNMNVVEGYSHKEIADKLGLTVSNSKTILSRTKSLMRQKLTKSESYEVEYK